MQTVWVYNQPSRSTQPSTLCGMLKWVSAFGLSNNVGDGGCSLIAASRRANGSSSRAWSKGLWPSGAVLCSSHEPGIRHSSSDSIEMLQRLINCYIIIIFITCCWYVHMHVSEKLQTESCDEVTLWQLLTTGPPQRPYRLWKPTNQQLFSYRLGLRKLTIN